MKRFFTIFTSFLILSVPLLFAEENDFEASAEIVELEDLLPSPADNPNEESDSTESSSDFLGETEKQQEDLFSESEEDEYAPAKQDITQQELNKPVHKSIPHVPDEDLARPEVERFRQQYLSEKWSVLLHDCLESAMEYRLYVRKTISDQQLPTILEYLPVVESNYKTTAKSRSGAIGMWQFMANSVWPFLTLNDYVDERLDPWKSTDAGLRKLTDNYNYFNDWYLAIAAYNCGVGAMNKVLKQSAKKDFWYLVEHNLLPKQTALYVPKLIAIADLAMNSEYYGIDLPNHQEEYEILENEKNGSFDYISVKKAYSLNSLANALRIDSKILKHLNPSYFLGFTHPSKESQIRLPLGMGDAAQTAIKTIEPITFPVKYKVVSGDSLWSISRKFGVSISSICELNGIQENAILRIGKILYIPSK